MDENIIIGEDLAHLARLATQENYEDVRLFLGRLIRKYRTTNPKLSNQLESTLKNSVSQSNRGSILRDTGQSFNIDAGALPVDADSKLSLIRVVDDRGGINEPLLSDALKSNIRAIIQEQHKKDKLAKHGISPTNTAILVGPPGVGKTLSARWIACELNKPLWILDLTAVMSSLLGKTGNNLRTVFDHAKKNEAVLLLDEIDAIAKKRSDESDIGELKRLVTVILQEVEQWPDSGLLLAATNHPELVDPALWRRFDQVLTFGNPEPEAIKAALKRFLGQDLKEYSSWVDILVIIMIDKSLSDVEKEIANMRRTAIMQDMKPKDVISGFVINNLERLSKQDRLSIALLLAENDTYSHHEINRITKVARDTIRKHAGPSARCGRGLK